MFTNVVDLIRVFLAWLACCFNVCLVLHAVLVSVCFTGCKVMITSEPKNKKMSAQTVSERFGRGFSHSTMSRRSFLEEYGSGDFSFAGPYEPVLLGPLSHQKEGVFRDIREIILEKNKIQIAFGFGPENSPCITAIVPSYCTK